MQPEKIIQSLSELPTMPSTIGTMAWNDTGDWRYLTPLVRNKLAPCSHNCPAGIPISSYLSVLRNGNVQRGLALLLSHNPLPGLTGRLCYHPCETKCVRKKIDQALSIQKIEQFLADIGTKVKIERSKTTDRRVMVIGSGPLGLSCAFFLSLGGCQVVIMDPGDRVGGALLDLSPEKIEPQVLDDEIKRLILLADIKLEPGAVIDFDAPGEQLSKADLAILDPTCISEKFTIPARAVAFDPFDDSSVSGDIIAPILPKNLTPFKPRMIAHYIAMGRLTAQKAFGCLVMPSGQQGLAQPNPDPPRQPVKVRDVKIERLLVSDVAPEAKTKREEVWDRERVLQEAQRCLSCGTCNLCLECVSFCPDASIRPDEHETSVVVDLDHCKGCGICAYECPRGVITMEERSS